jgi:hypothetical protein
MPENKVVMVIAFDRDTGQLAVQGPLPDKGLCYQMLELARDVVHDFKREQQNVIPASADALHILDHKKRNGG